MTERFVFLGLKGFKSFKGLSPLWVLINVIQKNWDRFQTALCQPAKPINTQSETLSFFKYKMIHLVYLKEKLRWLLYLLDF